MRPPPEAALVDGENQGLGRVGSPDPNLVALRHFGRVVDQDIGQPLNTIVFHGVPLGRMDVAFSLETFRDARPEGTVCITSSKKLSSKALSCRCLSSIVM